jgi:hypothetical protein
MSVSSHPRPTDHCALTFVCPTPGFIEAFLASTLRLVPRREDCSHLLHRGWIIRMRQLVVQRGTDSACARVRSGWRMAGKGACDDADHATAFSGAGALLARGSDESRVRRFTFSTLQLRGLMGDSELMVARRERRAEGYQQKKAP